jgi:hypothetical protein
MDIVDLGYDADDQPPAPPAANDGPPINPADAVRLIG